MQFDQSFKAISDPTRRKILDLLKNQTLTAGEIAELCQSTKPNISQHLNVLKQSGLVQDEKKGLYIYYSLVKSDFTTFNREVRTLITLKDKILQEIRHITSNKNCETVFGATDSQDEGTIYLMKDSATILSFHYSFLLSSFHINYIFPSGIQHLKIDYTDTNKVGEFLRFIESEVQKHIFELEKKKEQLQTITESLHYILEAKISNSEYFLTKNKEKLKLLKEIMNETLQSITPNYFSDEKEVNAYIEEQMKHVISLGKLHEVYEDPSISEIMINKYDEVWIEQQGKLKRTDITFQTEAELLKFAKRLATSSGISYLNNTMPFVNTHFSDGSSLAIVMPPISSKGITITIRKFFQEKLTMKDFINFGTLSEQMASFLESSVKARANIIVSGGTGAGKTTTLNILSNLIPGNERIITIEDSKELQLSNEHVVNLETRPANAEGAGEVTIRDLIKSSLYLRPERVIVGETRDGSAFDILRTMQTGHDGTMTSLHALKVDHVSTILCNLIQYAGFDLTDDFCKKLIGESVDLIVHIERLKDGSRKITDIVEVGPYDERKNEVPLNPLFHWKKEGEESGKLTGNYYFSGNSLSYDLKQKFEKLGFDCSLKKYMDETELKKMHIDNHLLDAILAISNGIKSGLSIHGTFQYIGEDKLQPLSSIFSSICYKMDGGLSLKDACLDIYKEFPSTDLSLFINVLISSCKNGGKAEPTFRRLYEVLSFRNEIRSTHPNGYLNMLYNSDDWKWMEFIDLLSIVCLHSTIFLDALNETCDMIDNRFSKEFKRAVKEINAGKPMKEALNDAVLRTDFVSTRTFVSQINQAIAFGISIDKTIEAHSEKIRNIMKFSF